MNTASELIVGEHLFKRYETEHEDHFALNDVSFSIQTGEYIAIVGNSGSGKTTLMNMIGFIDRPTKGNLYFDGINVSDYSDAQLAHLRNSSIGYVFQSFYLDPDYTVCQNVEMPLLIAGIPKMVRQVKIRDALQRVGMVKAEKQVTKTLSGGEKQRVCIARALICNPRIVLADEPCGNLDSANSKIIMDLLDDLHRNGKTVVLITHNMEHAARAGRRITIKDGRIQS